MLKGRDKVALREAVGKWRDEQARREKEGFIPESIPVLDGIPDNLRTRRVVVRIDGRTSLSSSAFGLPELKPVTRSPKGGGFTGWFSYERSRPKVSRVVSALEALAEAHTGCSRYLITATFPDSVGNDERFERWAKFVARIRKEKPLGYLWTTELHRSNLQPYDGGNTWPPSFTGGTTADGSSMLVATDAAIGSRFHFHMVVIFQKRWEFGRHVKRWSKHYCASANGLDLRPIRGRLTYPAKYVGKLEGSTVRTRRRLWGYSQGLPMSVTVDLPKDPDVFKGRPYVTSVVMLQRGRAHVREIVTSLLSGPQRSPLSLNDWVSENRGVCRRFGSPGVVYVCPRRAMVLAITQTRFNESLPFQFGQSDRHCRQRRTGKDVLPSDG